MAYSPTNWGDGTTPVDASNLNKIENALTDQDTRIDSFNTIESVEITEFLNDFGGTAIAYKVGKVKFLYLYLSSYPSTSGETVLICYLPEGYRPESRSIIQFAGAITRLTNGMWFLRSDGRVQVYANSAISTASYLWVAYV